MKNRWITITLLILVVLSGSLLFFLQDFNIKAKTLYIAVIGPMSGVNELDGQSMLQGVQLYIDKVNRENILGQNKIELLVFDDKNDKRIAMRVANEVKQNDNILMVIGHYYSTTSIAAGDIYKKNGIPAITASATSNDVTSSNEWYFRIIPDNNFEGAFIAQYINKVLLKQTVTIIHDQDNYGISLFKGFEQEASDLGINIKRKWSYDTDSKEIQEDLKKIVVSLRTMDDPGIIFLATHATEAATIVSGIKYPGAKYSIIASDAVSGETFLTKLREYPAEQAIPGYYSNGIYAISPLILSLSNNNTLLFKQEFKNRFGKSPSWGAACYYDAARLVVDALKKAEITNNSDIRNLRRKIKSALSDWYNTYDMALQGISGSLYFDKNRSVTRPLDVGVYYNQEFLPAFSQYQFLAETKGDKLGLKESLGSNILVVHDRVMTKTNIVYTGIDINRISDIDVENSTANIDFYIWFCFQEDFKDSDIIFLNAIEPVKLSVPFKQEVAKDSIVRSYHVNADFKMDLDFHKYPFDEQIIDIKFRHKSLRSNKLLYVPDHLGEFRKSEKDIKKRLEKISDIAWKIKDISFFQDIVTEVLKLSTMEYKFNYSQFNAKITIHRKNIILIAKKLFPLIIFIIILYSVSFFPHSNLLLRFIVCIIILLLSGLYHWRFSIKLLSQLSIIDSLYFMLYILIFLSIGISFYLKLLCQSNMDIKLAFIDKLWKVIYPFASFISILVISYIYYKI